MMLLTTRLQITFYILFYKKNNKCNNYYCSTFFYNFRHYFKHIFMRPGKFYKHITGKIAFLTLLLLGIGYSGFAQVAVTKATNGTGICSTTAATETGTAFTNLGPIVLTENLSSDFAAGSYTISIDAPAGWQYSSG